MAHEEGRSYLLPNGACGISSNALILQDESTQMEVMRKWFLGNFENPNENTPFDSAEGGYIFIWGGPFNAQDELETEFREFVSHSVIENLAKVLSIESPEWSGKPGRGDLADFFVNSAIGTDYFDNFQNSIHKIVGLAKSNIDPALGPCFSRLLFANIIYALEAYLSDAFYSSVLSSPKLLRQFVEAFPDYKKEKCSISQIYQQTELMRGKVISSLGKIIWHDLIQAKKLYKETFDIDFPQDDISKLLDAILVRHDIVHRNGKTTTGIERRISLEDIYTLLARIETFVSSINAQLVLFILGLTDTHSSPRKID